MRAHVDALTKLRALVIERRNGDDADLDRAIAIVCEALSAPLGKILELNPAGDALFVRAGYGWDEGLAESVLVSSAVTSVAGYSLAHRGAVLFNDVQGTKRFTDAGLLRSYGVTATLAVRLDLAGGRRGVLSVHERTTRRFTAAEATFVEQAAMIISGRSDATVQRRREEQ